VIRRRSNNKLSTGDEGSKEMTKIFISYRRDDSPYIAGIINERLEKHFGPNSVFFDIDSIPLGLDFRKRISDSVGQCNVLLAIIGDSWINAINNHGGRRLEDPADFVRLEIESALKRDIPVIPVLVGKARVPSEKELPSSLKELAFRNAAEVRAGRDLQEHLSRLVRGIDALSQISQSKNNQTGLEVYPSHDNEPIGKATEVKPTSISRRRPRQWLSVRTGIITLVVGLVSLGAITIWKDLGSSPTPTGVPTARELPTGSPSATSTEDVQSNLLAKGCINAALWSSLVSESGGQNSNCLSLDKSGVLPTENGLRISFTNNSVQTVRQGLFMRMEKGTQVKLKLAISELYTPSANNLANLSLGIVSRSSFDPEKDTLLIYQRESPQEGYPIFVKQKERGDNDSYLSEDKTKIRYVKNTPQEIWLDISDANQLTICLDGSALIQVALPSQDRVFWVGYRLPAQGLVEAEISEFQIQQRELVKQPEQFIINYYDLINKREYCETWQMLTLGFQNRNVWDGFDGYKEFWNGVARVEIQSVEVTGHDGKDIIVSVTAKYTASQGTESIDTRSFRLTPDPTGESWLFEK
jgi:hypothetical protein